MCVSKPVLFNGGLTVDDRGHVSFVNDFTFEGVKRFYLVSNHQQGFVRAWHGHKKEAKYFFVVKGAALICGVEIDNWDNPSKDLKIHKFVLTEKNPSILYLPEGYANGIMSLTEDAQIMVFSTSKLEDALNDDIRFDSRYWNPWEIREK